MTEVFLIQKIKKLRHQVFRQHFPSLWRESSPAVILQCQRKEQLVEPIPFSWNVHRIQCILKERSNKTVILKSWLLPTGTFFFSAFLTILFPNAPSTETQQMQTKTVVSLVSELAQTITIPSITAFWDHYFQQIRVLNLVWRLKGKLNGPTEYYHKPLLTIFLCFKWSLNYGITRHYAKNPILFEQSHYPTFWLLWPSSS